MADLRTTDCGTGGESTANELAVADHLRTKPKPDKFSTFDRHVHRVPGGCWEWQGYRDKDGYGRYRRWLAHRVAYERANGPVPPGMVVCHHCDNPACVNLEHMFLGTPSENMRDMVAKGRGGGGEDHIRSKLTWDDVREIRRSELSNPALAKRFGVTASCIWAIRSGRTWKMHGDGATRHNKPNHAQGVAACVMIQFSQEIVEGVAREMQRARDELGASEQQRIAFAYAEAAMRSALEPLAKAKSTSRESV